MLSIQLNASIFCPSKEKSEYLNRYSSSFYRIETDLNRLTSETKFLVDLSKSKSSISVEDYLQPLSVLRKFYRKNKPRVPSVRHRIHGSYNLSDIFEIDPELAREVEIVAKYFGYKLSNKDLDYDDVVGTLGTGRAKVQSSLTASEHASTFENYLMTQDDSDEKLFNCFDMNNI